VFFEIGSLFGELCNKTCSPGDMFTTHHMVNKYLILHEGPKEHTSRGGGDYVFSQIGILTLTPNIYKRKRMSKNEVQFSR